jgi:hypothetical protein
MKRNRYRISRFFFLRILFEYCTSLRDGGGGGGGGRGS